MKCSLWLAIAGLFAGVFVFLTTSLSDVPPNDSEFVYARIRYHLNSDGYRVREVPWHHDYSFSDEVFPDVLSEITNVRTSRTSYQLVDIDSPELFKYPFAYLCEPGYMELNARDVVNLREYLDRGGFLLVDDFRTADNSVQGGVRGFEDDIAVFRSEMKKVYPDRDFVHLNLSDPIFHSFFDIATLDMPAPYFFPGQHDVEFLGLRDNRGHLQMILDNNNDISEDWEWLDKGNRSMHEARTSLEFGINDVIYAMTH
jgi:Domain of unknown function (DUF4159)